MQLSPNDVQQLDAEFIATLSCEGKTALILKLVADLIEAHDRLNQDSHNSSCPPSSELPWRRSEDNEDQEDHRAASSTNDGNEDDEAADDESDHNKTKPSGDDDEDKSRKPGRAPGMPGYGRTVDLPISGRENHYPEQCVICGQALDSDKFVAWNGCYVLDLVQNSDGLAGLELTHVLHVYGDIACGCGHVNRTEPGRCEKEEGWEVALTEWRVVGPTLAALIVCLSLRMRCSRRSIQEFLLDWFGVYLSTATINRCIHEAGRAVAPLEQQLAEEIRQAELLHADETTWKEAGQLLWLWVFCSSTVTLYLIGYRSKEIIQTLLENDFAGWLMSDGYTVYRDFLRRLRCWAHLIRKAEGLVESLNSDARPFGEAAKALLTELMKAVRKAREGPPVNLQPLYAEQLARFKLLCEQYRDSPHKKTKALAREFLNDWDAMWMVLQHPWLPLTNNEAERALRHWVIARLISHGTRTAEGTRVFSLLASVIETCRKRNIIPWPYIALVITERRKGHAAPPIPAAGDKAA